MTYEELALYNGINKPKRYLGCKHFIFDVTSSDFYTESGSYSKFVGKDVSVNLAKMSFNESDFNKYGTVKLSP